MERWPGVAAGHPDHKMTSYKWNSLLRHRRVWCIFGGYVGQWRICYEYVRVVGWEVARTFVVSFHS